MSICHLDIKLDISGFMAAMEMLVSIKARNPVVYTAFMRQVKSISDVATMNKYRCHNKEMFCIDPSENLMEFMRLSLLQPG